MDSSAYLQHLDARLEAAGFERIEPALPNLGSLRACRREIVIDELPWKIVCVVLPGTPGLTVQELRQTSFTVYDTVHSTYSRPFWSHLVVFPLVLMSTVSAELALEIRSACKPKSHLTGVELPVVVDLTGRRIHYPESGLFLGPHRKQARELFSFPGDAELPEAASSETASTAPSAPATPPLLFVSYRREDSADATGRLCDRLTERFGREVVFRDVDSIPLGVDFRRIIEEKVGACQVLLAVIGRDWLTAGAAGRRRLDDPDDFVRIEIEAALRRDVRVIPVLVGGARMPAAEELPESLREMVFRNGIPLRPDPDFHGDVDRLLQALSG
jgi:hypothetical protein